MTGDAGSGPGAPPPGSDPLQEGPIAPAELPEFACESAASRSLLSHCAGCHGSANTPAPDLWAFAGSEEEFVARVRRGGDGMPAFDGSVLSDQMVQELYALLQAGPGQAPAVSLGSLEPLFPAGDQAPLPISFVRDDGVLITRGAGRVRGRHELEEFYGPFGSHYFEGRTFGFLIEDYTPRGESRIVVSYLPLSFPQDSTNFRAFKIYGDGNVFHANTGMDSDTPLPSLRPKGGGVEQDIDYADDYATRVAPYARVQSRVIDRNARTGEPLAQGDWFEFEFGVFIDPAAVSPQSRTAYYTDTFRYRIGRGGLSPENLDPSGQPGPSARAFLGGASTLAWSYAEPELYFSQLALNVQHEHVQHFVEGRRLFHTNFENGEHSEGGNPALAEQANKLGPLFVSKSCVSCHLRNGGGRSLEGTLDDASSMAFKLYGDAALGNQLQLQEGSAVARAPEQRSVVLADGEVVTLTRPRYDVRDLEGAELPHSARIARRLVGLGLLEAIDEATLLARADPDDCDGDGISGRPQLVRDPRSGVPRIGRFGWRAEKVSVEHQVADALSADLGVSTGLLPGPGGESELSEADVSRLTTYMRLLGVPAQRGVEDSVVARGEELFHAVGCANCHVAALTTGTTHPFVELRGQPIRPYTDLLLHDLGEDLADASGLPVPEGSAPEAAAGASEWRTAPLWGGGLSQQVQDHVALLHDGRAHSVLEAVLWHGGEAEAARERVVALSREEREALVRFVESL